MNKHIKRIHGTHEFNCDTCQYKTNTKQILKQHIRAAYRTDESNQFKTNTNANLKCHIKGVHGTDEFSCISCQYKTNTKCKLKQHIKAVHGKDVIQDRVLKEFNKFSAEISDDDDDEDAEERSLTIREQVPTAGLLNIKQRFVCPISNCTFNLNENNTIILKHHIEEKHPNASKLGLKFLVL